MSHRKQTRLRCERLEYRNLLAAVDGQLFFDRNLDHTRQSDEPGIDEIEIRLINRGSGEVLTATSSSRDLDGNGAIDSAGESGWYRFDNVPAGRWSLVPTLVSPLELPAGSLAPIDVAPNQVLRHDIAIDVKPMLQPGDANQDFYIGIDDLVQAIQAGTWQQDGATWSTGDWATDQLGSLGAPPQGDGRFDQSDIDALLGQRSDYGGPAYNRFWAASRTDELRPVTTIVDQPATVITYDEITGDVIVTSNEPIAAFQLRTHSISLRDYADTESLVRLGPLDVSERNEIGLIRFVASSRIDLPGLLAPQLSVERLATELRVDGARWSGGDLGEVVVVSRNYTGLAASIAAVAYVDANQDGKRGADELGTGGVTIEVTSNLFLSGDRQIVSRSDDVDGNGTIDPLTEQGLIRGHGYPAGEYLISIAPPSGWELTTAPRIDATLSAGEIFEFSVGVIRFANGDTNFDGRVDASDIDTICRGINTGFYRDELDVNADGRLNFGDVLWQVRRELGATIGDANLDGRFDSADLVQVLTAAEYEDGIDDNSSWSTGDWNCDRDFDAFDLVEALQTGDYEPVVTTAAVARHQDQAIDKPRRSALPANKAYPLINSMPRMQEVAIRHGWAVYYDRDGTNIEWRNWRSDRDNGALAPIVNRVIYGLAPMLGSRYGGMS